MHPYCLKLHVEEEEEEEVKLRKNHTLFSQEEVWKYERPSEESDEEINVVSDDEATVKETKEEEGGGEERDNGRLLRGVLLNGNSTRAPPSREKKRVSFGPVQVASFDESAGKGLNEKNRTSGHASETVSVPPNSTKALPAGSALEPQTPSPEMSSNEAEVLPPKGETKAKSLSLQQYRQLRQKRQPLVEKQGNYTTKWPSVSEPPKELTPILCLQNSCGPKTAHHYPDGRRSSADQVHRSQTAGFKTHRASAPFRPHPSEAKPSTHLRRSGLKRPRIESKVISPVSPLPDVTANPNVIPPESKKSPVKKPTLLSSDPPNPVLLPLSVSQTASPSPDHPSSESKVEFLNIDSNLDSTRHFQEIQTESSGTSLKGPPSSSLGPEQEVVLPNQDCTTLFQEIKNKLTEIASGLSSRSPAWCPTTAQTESSSERKQPQPEKCSPNPTIETKLEPKSPSFAPRFSQPPSPADAPLPAKETLPEVPPSNSLPEEPALQFVCRVQSATADSGKLLRPGC